MRYVVTDRFYNAVSALIGIALEDEHTIEYDLAMSIVRDLITEED